MSRLMVVLFASFLLSGCPREAPRPAADPDEEAPSPPRVDQAFVRAVLNPEARLATEPVLVDLDRSAPGTEALVVFHVGGKDHELALVRGNRKVLARVPLRGKVLLHASIRQVGALQVKSLLEGGGKVGFLPVETEVKRVYVCGFLTFRYRAELLVMSGELGSRCWRKAAGAPKDVDPHSLLKIARSDSGVATVEVQQNKGTRTYSWDKQRAAFVATANTE